MKKINSHEHSDDFTGTASMTVKERNTVSKQISQKKERFFPFCTRGAIGNLGRNFAEKSTRHLNHG